MSDSANTWAPQDSIPVVTTDSSVISESFTATAGQLVFYLTQFTYVVGTGSLLIFKNGLALRPGTDFTETSDSKFTLASSATAGDVILAVGFLGEIGGIPADTYIVDGPLQITGDLTVGPVATPAMFVDVSENTLYLGKGVATNDIDIEIGSGRTDNGFVNIDLIGDTTYTNYGTRLVRGNTGANTTSELLHRGTGRLIINAVDAGIIRLATNNISRAEIDPSGILTLSGGSDVTAAGANGYLILGATTGINLALDSNEIMARNNGVVSNLHLQKEGGTVSINGDTVGKVGIGISTPDTNLHVWNGSAGAVAAAANSLLTLENDGNLRLQMLSPNTGIQSLYFGDADDNDVGSLTYSHNGKTLTAVVETVSSLQIDDTVTAGNTRLLIYDVDKAALSRVRSNINSVVQVVEATPYTTYSSHTTVIPLDNTIPQSTEGEGIMTESITPTNATNRLRITIVVDIHQTTAGVGVVSLFKDVIANALASGVAGSSSGPLTVVYEMAAGTTSSILFKVRVGPSVAGTLYLNGDSSSRLLGGISAVRLKIEEIAIAGNQQFLHV